eukprot:NODE_634_length_1553_cov_61.514628_g522_i0.p1 GENE.NODE_634_length_1553_cov_61.514628_g522_i0~~NODE_634_length_1553_cov_61.514628_g522_i0.p1  ORF type:complete len:337 (+),score=61.54 NODE_634_length_1553_cov_61.514628_g522_i0:438-1448(+)
MWTEYVRIRRAERHQPTTIIASSKEGLTVNTRMLHDVFVATMKRGGHDSHRTHGDCRQYLEGLIWCLVTYVTGCCPNYSFAYCDDAVSVRSLTSYLKSNPTIKCPRNPEVPLTPLMNYVALLPPEGRCELPKPMREVLLAFGYDKEKQTMEKDAALALCNPAHLTLSSEEKKASRKAMDKKVRDFDQTMAPDQIVSLTKALFKHTMPDEGWPEAHPLMEFDHEICYFLSASGPAAELPRTPKSFSGLNEIPKLRCTKPMPLTENEPWPLMYTKGHPVKFQFPWSKRHQYQVLADTGDWSKPKKLDLETQVATLNNRRQPGFKHRPSNRRHKRPRKG